MLASRALERAVYLDSSGLAPRGYQRSPLKEQWIRSVWRGGRGSINYKSDFDDVINWEES